MHIAQALQGVELLSPPEAGGEVTGVQYDSRRVGPGDVFVAMRGGAADGNRFIPAALAQGAGLVVTDNPETYAQLKAAGTPAAHVAHGRRALAGISANLFGHPERALRVSAVTGTNGKTTTAFLLEQLLAPRTTVLIGTIETRVAGQVLPSEHTTPEARDLFALFAQGVAAGASDVVMEMSSHGLARERVWGVPVDVAIFTNLTQDHLDFHGTMEHYRAAKMRLFKGVGAPPPRVAVLNVDDPVGLELANTLRGPQVLRYGIDAGDYRAENLRLSAGHTEFRFRTPAGSVELASPLSGRVNVLNLLAASCAALAGGVSLEGIAAAVPGLAQVPGRFELVPGSATAGFAVVVDYAHTDDALRNLVTLARALVQPSGGRVFTLFGCGGDRDRTKRPRMGRAAGEGSDLVFLTSDNPRSEDPHAILEEALAGVRATGTAYLVEPDRACAIALAVAEARPGDIVLLAGKGHEKVQIFAGGPVPFDDVAVAAAALVERTESCN